MEALELKSDVDFVPAWCDASLAPLESVARENPQSLQGLFAQIQLDAAANRGEDAKRRLGTLLEEHAGRISDVTHLYQNVVQCLIALGQVECAAQIINQRMGVPDWCGVSFDAGVFKAPNMLVWKVLDRQHCEFRLSRDLFISLPNPDMVIRNWLSCLPVLASYGDNGEHKCGEVVLNAGDHGVEPGLAFSDFRPNFFLIPDPVFLSNRGYLRLRQHYSQNEIPWRDRIPKVFWRGATTGQRPNGRSDVFLLPRIQLCMKAQQYPDLFDVGLNRIVQLQPEEIGAISESGLMRPSVPDTQFQRFRCQIDIDGNSNAWAALFTKLLAGCTVLKVASPRGFSQWYYDRLLPWVHFVPVEADMSDLVEKAEWVRNHDNEAQEIGERGRELAYSLTYESEVLRCRSTIYSALAFFNK